MVRPTGPRVLATLFVGALLSYTFFFAPKLGQHSAAESDDGPPVVGGTADPGGSGPRRPLFPPAGKTFIGIATAQGAQSFAPVDAFAKAAGRRPAAMLVYDGWAAKTFDRAGLDKVARRGSMPIVSWEPWNFRDDSEAKDGTDADQPAYQLSRITRGDYDQYLKTYAEGVKSLNYAIGIRLAHEMNGFWYPWGGEVNGNQRGDYVKMWRHVHDAFKAAGATNVVWIWSPNITYDTKDPLNDLYPGDDYVDWLGLSGYYGTAGTTGYKTPAAVFDATLGQLRTFTRKPLVITETGATDVTGQKAQWISDFAGYLPKHPDIIGFIWYETVRETDWRIASSAAASKAFATLAADPRYDMTWTQNSTPRLTVDLPAAPSPTTAPPTIKTPATSSTTQRPTPNRTKTSTPTTTGPGPQDPSSTTPSNPQPSPSG